MAWTTSLTETQNAGRQTLTFSVSGNNADDAVNTKRVSFETLQGGGYYRTFTSVTYNEFDDIIDLLTQDLAESASAANVTPENEYDVVLDFSALTDDRLWIDLRFLSSHQRPDLSRDLRDGVDAYSVGSAITHIIGTDNDDHIIGSYQAETIEGGDGDDYIAGGGGDDILKGGDGDDVITPGNGNDTIDGGEGRDTLWMRWIHGQEKTVGASLMAIATGGDSTADYYDEALAFKALIDAYEIDASTIGVWVRMDADGTGTSGGYSFSYLDMDLATPHDDEGLHKNSFINIENITITTHNVRDDDNTILKASALIEGDDGDNHIISGHGDDLIFGGGGNDRIFGGAGDDLIYGGEGNDKLYAGWHGGTLYGEGGEDRLVGGIHADILYGGDDDDRLDGHSGNDILYGGAGGDRMWGGRGDDRLYGGVGDDMLKGGGGDDILEGGGGEDSLDGGEGNDTASYAHASSGVTVDLSLSGAQATNRIDSQSRTTTLTSDQTVTHIDVGEYIVIDSATGSLVLRDRLSDFGDDDILFARHTADGIELLATIDDEGWSLSDDDVLTITSGYQISENDLSNGDAAGDRLSSIEHLRGSDYDDILTGNGEDNIFEGGDGADMLIGGIGSDTASYAHARSGVTASLEYPSANTGEAWGDVYNSIENLIGSDFDDTLRGSNSEENIIEGGGGADTINGGASSGMGNTASYASSPGGVSVDLTLLTQDYIRAIDEGRQLTVSSSLSVSVSADDYVVLSERNGVWSLDVKTAGEVADPRQNFIIIAHVNSDGDGLESYGRADTDDNGSISFDAANSLVLLTITSGSSSVVTQTYIGNADAAGDQFSLINHLRGSAYDDVLRGNANSNILEGGAGADVLDGGGGYDTASYAHASSGVTASLTDSRQNTGEAAGDSYISIENLTGSEHDDHLIGNNTFFNALRGGDGNDILESRGGVLNYLYGGEGNDTASYAHASSGVTASLANSSQNKGEAAGTLLYSSIENLLGSVHDDRLAGDGYGNILDGNGGSDRLTGGAGDDVFILDLSDSGDDTVTDFGTGSNVIRITGDGSQTNLSDSGIEVSDNGTDTTLYYDSDDDGTAETLVMTLQNFTGWDESSHLDIV